MRAVYYNIGTLVAFQSKQNHIHDESLIMHDKGIVVNDGAIESIQDSSDLVHEYSISPGGHGVQNETQVHNVRGNAVVPGLIDAHTHLLWAGDRSQEVGWRREGLSYADIASRGGGIQHTVHATRQADDDELFSLGYQRLREALHTGTTHLEAKSGYGLDTATELRLLDIASKLNDVTHTPTLDLTWMGAHDVPKGTSAPEYVDHLLSEQLPAVVSQGLARSSDVFCEPGWFSVEQSEDILRESRKHGLSLRMHVDEFMDGGGGALACELNVDTADHAYHTPLNVRHKMRELDINTGFLPGTPYAMGDPWPDMEQMVELGIPYTLATDFNPNCRTLSLPFMCSLMVQRCGMHPLNALASVTVHAAKTTPHPTGRAHGVLEQGAVANFNIVDGPHWESLALRPSASPFCATVLNGGFIAH